MKTILILLFLPFLLFGQDTSCKAYFSPKDNLADKLIQLINHEKESIKLASFSIAHAGIAKALIEAKIRGVELEILIDPAAIKTRSSIHRFLDARLSLFVWDQSLSFNPTKRKALMHDTFCVFGNKTVWTGSFNFTNDANLRHRENALVIESPEIAAQFLTQFTEMKLYQSRPYEEYLAFHPKKKKIKKASEYLAKSKL